MQENIDAVLAAKFSQEQGVIYHEGRRWIYEDGIGWWDMGPNGKPEFTPEQEKFRDECFASLIN